MENREHQKHEANDKILISTFTRICQNLGPMPLDGTARTKKVCNVLTGHSIPYKNLTLPVWKENFWRIHGLYCSVTEPVFDLNQVYEDLQG